MRIKIERISAQLRNCTKKIRNERIRTNDTHSVRYACFFFLFLVFFLVNLHLIKEYFLKHMFFDV